MPISGSLTINSRPDHIPYIYSEKEAEAIGRGGARTIERAYNKSELETENARLRKELNDLKLKEVESQQTKFGVGIN